MTTLDSFALKFGESRRRQIVGTGSRSCFCTPSDSQAVDTRALTGVVSHDVSDQVVEVWAGTTVEELQSALQRHGQCLPLAIDVSHVVSQQYGTIGGLLAMNLPHALSSQCGGPRDWTIGMTVVRTDGSVAKSGCKAVKSVAGYDAHKLFVGSRGLLGAIAKVTLRTYPTRAVPAHTVEQLSDDVPIYIARTLRADFEAFAGATPGLVALDPASCTVWSTAEPTLPQHAWLIGPNGLVRSDSTVEKLEAKARKVFDPGDKLELRWQ